MGNIRSMHDKCKLLSSTNDWSRSLMFVSPVVGIDDRISDYADASGAIVDNTLVREAH